MSTTTNVLSSLLILALPSVLVSGDVILFGTLGGSVQNGAEESGLPTEAGAQDAAKLEVQQTQLLELAYQAASKFPLQPHVKNRSRVQEMVALTTLELGAPTLALRYFDGIANWRRGSGYAEYALYLATHKSGADVPHYLELAKAIADAEEGWRKQRIYGTLARTFTVLGDTRAAQALLPGMDPVEAQRLAPKNSGDSNLADYEQHIAWAKQTFLAGNLDFVRAAFKGCARLYRSNYADSARREALEAFVQESIHKGPLDMGVETLLEMARAAIDNQDSAQGLKFVVQVEDLIRGVTWLPEHQIPMVCRVAEVRFLCGDRDAAASMLEAMAELYAQHAGDIVDIFRADALIPLAQAFYATGNRSRALEIYSMAVREGSRNPNSRPRVEDLVATCCSLARIGIDPGDELMGQLRTASAGLGDPW